jgi:hypothetical protein
MMYAIEIFGMAYRAPALLWHIKANAHLAPSNALKFRGAACGAHPRTLRFHVPCLPCGWPAQHAGPSIFRAVRGEQRASAALPLSPAGNVRPSVDKTRTQGLTCPRGRWQQQEEWGDMSIEDAPRKAAAAEEWLDGWFARGRFSPEVLAAAAERAAVVVANTPPPPPSRLPPPNTAPFSVPTPKCPRVQLLRTVCTDGVSATSLLARLCCGRVCSVCWRDQHASAERWCRQYERWTGCG